MTDTICNDYNWSMNCRKKKVIKSRIVFRSGICIHNVQMICQFHRMFQCRARESSFSLFPAECWYTLQNGAISSKSHSPISIIYNSGRITVIQRHSYQFMVMESMRIVNFSSSPLLPSYFADRRWMRNFWSSGGRQ